jgi:uncharacterized protein YyaL (SSP411 family)
VLHKLTDDEQFVEDNDLDLSALQDQKALWKSSLMEVRLQRPKPRIDDKVITSWNALLISGLVQAYQAFGDKMFLEEAVWVFDSLMKTNHKRDRLVHSYKEGSKQAEGFIEDYACLTDASIALYKVTMDTEYLHRAQKLTGVARQEYKDKSSGLFLNNNNDKLIAKTIRTNDGDLPSPNSLMARNLLILGHLEYNKMYLEESKTMLSTMLPLLEVNPDSYAGWGSLFLNVVYPYYEIAVVGAEAPKLAKELQQYNLPNTLIAGSTRESELPLFKSRFVEGETYIYVCRNNACKLPVTSAEEAIEQIGSF